MYFTPYRPEVVGQEEQLIFGPKTLHGDASKMKCEQMGIKNINDYLDKVIKSVHSKIPNNKLITDHELEDPIKEILD